MTHPSDWKRVIDDDAWPQLSLLEEPEVLVTLRWRAVRGDPYYACDVTLTRPDDSWVACEVYATPRGTQALREQLAWMVDRSIVLMESAVPPF